MIVPALVTSRTWRFSSAARLGGGGTDFTAGPGAGVGRYVQSVIGYEPDGNVWGTTDTGPVPVRSGDRPQPVRTTMISTKGPRT